VGDWKESLMAPSVVGTFRSRWAEFVPFLSYPPELRRMFSSKPSSRRAVMERLLEAEMTEHLGHERHQNFASPSGELTCTCIRGSSREKKNPRKFRSRKTVGLTPLTQVRLGVCVTSNLVLLA
jgi:transposase-like protein